jgi:hypothetical protein
MKSPRSRTKRSGNHLFAGYALSTRALKGFYLLTGKDPRTMSIEDASAELSTFTIADILRIPRLGRKTLQELKSLMNNHGREFAVSRRFIDMDS